MNSSEHLLAKVTRHIKDSQDVLGLLVYGSYAKGTFHTLSDIDLICITKNQHNYQYMVVIDEVTVDVYASTFQLLEKSICSDLNTNNNFILDALNHGRPLASENGNLEALTTLAKEVWERGPSKPSILEQQSIAAALEKAVNTAKRFSIRINESLEFGEIAHIQMSYLFIQTVYAYCRINRLWASTIWEMLKWKDLQYMDLIALCRNYLKSNSFEERLSALRNLVEVVLSKIKLNLKMY